MRKKKLPAFSRISAAEYREQLKAEKDIQAEIIQILKFNKIIHTVTDASRIWGPDGRPRPSKVDKDWPDITCITKLPVLQYGGNTVAWRRNCCVLVETKTPDGELSPGQKSLHKRIREEEGTPILVPRSREDFVRQWAEATSITLVLPDQLASLDSQSARTLLDG